MIKALLLGLKLLRRQWHIGLLKLLTISFLLCITLMSGMNTLSSRLNKAMSEQASSMMGADLILTSSQPIEMRIIEKAKSLNLEHTVLIEFITMSLFQDTPILATVKAVELPYPLIGIQGIPEEGTIWVHADWQNRFGVQLNDKISIGKMTFTVGQFIFREPEVGASVFSIAPRALINKADIEKTAVIQPGSRIEYRLQLVGDAVALTTFANWLKPQLNPNEQLVNLKTDRPELSNTIERAERYLVLVAFCSILLGGSTILLVLREFAHSQQRTVSLLRTFGVSKNKLMVIYLGTLVLFAILLGMIGTVLGYGLQAGVGNLLQQYIGMDLPSASLSTGLIGIVTGVILMMGFSFPYLRQLVQQSPLSIFQEQVQAPLMNWGLMAVSILGGLFAILVMYTQDLKFSLNSLVLFALMFVVAVLFLSVIISALQSLKKWMKFPYKLGLGRLAQHKSDSILQILGVSLSLTLVLLLCFVRQDLVSQWQKTFPENPPNHFIFNILPNDVAPIQTEFDQAGITHTPFFPIVKARLISINDQPIDLTKFPAGEVPNYLKRELNNTALDVPRSIDPLVEGHWWPQGITEHAVSVEESVAQTLHIKIGDILGFTVADKQFAAKVFNIRQVQWENFEPNFYMIFSENTLKDYPTTYLTSIHLSDNKTILTVLAREFPSATVISVSDVLDEITRIMDQSSDYMGGLLAIIILSSILLMMTTSRSQLQSRLKDARILRRLGASRNQLLWGMLSEVTLISLLSCAIAFIAASSLVYYLGSQVFQIQNVHVPWFYFMISLLCILIIQSYCQMKGLIFSNHSG